MQDNNINNEKVETKKSSIFTSRKFKVGTMATSLTALVVVAVIVVNFIFSIVDERYPITIDLTPNRFFELSDDSIAFTKEITTPITISFLAEATEFEGASAYYQQVIEIIKKYEKYNDIITVNFIDILKNPEFVAKYPNERLDQYDVLIESATRTRVIPINDMFNIDYGYGSNTITSSKAEWKMTSALMYVSSEETTRVSVLTGMEEQMITGYVDYLVANNYEVVYQDILTQNIDPESSMAIIHAPSRDYTEDLLKKLDTFLDNDGNFNKHLIYITDPTQPATPNLDAFMEEWGIKINTGIVMETNPANVYNYSNMPFASFADEYSAGELMTRGVRCNIPNARFIEKAFTEKDNRETKDLLTFASSSVVLPMDAPDDFRPEDAEDKGPFSAMIKGSRVKFDNTGEPYISSVTVIPSLNAVASQFITSTSFANGEYFLNYTNYITGRQDYITVTPKELGVPSLPLNASQVYTIAAIFVIGVPLVVLILGLVQWLRRRHL